MTEPWRAYEEIQPISAAGISLVQAFGDLVHFRWDIHGVELCEAMLEQTAPGEMPVEMVVNQCALQFQEAAVSGKIATWVRPLNGGAPVELDPVHWEIDYPLPRIATGLMNLVDWTNPDAEPTHRIFVNGRDFRAFLASFMTEDEVWQALSADDAKPGLETPGQVSGDCPTSIPNTRIPETSPLTQPGMSPEVKMLRRPAVMEMCGISRSTIDNYMKAGTFPQSYPLGPNAVGWYLSEITAWIESRGQKNS